MQELRTHLFTIGVDGQPGTAILLCLGQMVGRSLERLRGALAAATNMPVPVVEVDLRKVSQIDHGAAAVLMQARQDLGAQGRELRLAVNPQVEALLRRLGAASLLNPQPPPGAAVARLRPGAESEKEAGRTIPPESEE